MEQSRIYRARHPDHQEKLETYLVFSKTKMDSPKALVDED